MVKYRRLGSGTISSKGIQEVSIDDGRSSGDGSYGVALQNSNNIFNGMLVLGDTGVVPPRHYGMYVET